MDKLIKNATKAKRAAPKAKYIDPIVQATFNQDASIQEILRSLTLRLRDDNTTVIFKALLVLHTLLRSGSLDPTYSYLASSSISLSLSSSDSPNLAAYASYLAARIKSYGTLKRDVIRDKTDRRATNRLRALGVDKGLLREVREVQRMIASLAEAKFYLDDIDDDVAMSALRLLVKDLLVLFQVVNEGVINVLEHYFEMSHPDATMALKIYKTFCRDTEKVVAYLSVAKKLQNVLNVPIPNLKHAPVSLAGSLEEYLNDANFAANREEYKENKRIADGGAPSKKVVPASTSSTTANPSTPPTIASSSSATNPTAFTDFFESIESVQTSMFNPSTDSPTSQHFQQQTSYNPFLLQQQQQQQLLMQQQQEQQQQMMMQHQMMTGAGGGVFGAMPGYPSNALIPQATGMGYAAFGGAPPNPFMQQQQQQQPFQSPTSPFLQAQSTGFPPLPQQYTGSMVANPFRQTMIFAQATGAGGAAFSPGGGGHAAGSQFGNQNQPFGQFQQQQPTGSSPFGQQQTQPQQQQQPQQQSQQSQSYSPHQSLLRQSTLMASNLSSLPTPSRSNTAPATAALVPQSTGSNNPFGQRPVPVAATPAVPSMGELAFGMQNLSYAQQQQQPQSNGSSFASPLSQSQSYSQQNNQQQQQVQVQRQQPMATGMGSIASEFAFLRSTSPASASPLSQSSTAPPSPFSAPPPATSFSSFSPSSTMAAGPSSTFVSKPFVPTSSFGASMSDALGPSPIVQHATGMNGGGAPNPFRMTTNQGSAATTTTPFASNQYSGTTMGGSLI